MKCSKCNKFYTGYPAISRKDNKTKICSECGLKEALEGFFYFSFNNKEVQNEAGKN